MRKITLGLFALALAGCQTYDPIRNEIGSHYRLPAKLYKNAAELGGQKYTIVAEVNGADCQISTQDSPPNITTARQDMLMRASKLGANAVLLNSCEVMGNVPGCYRQAVCSGSALNTEN